jgi:WD40 repeat protein/serine/threonine protein kinase
MKPDPGRAKSIFLSAVEIAEAAARDAFVAAQCGADEDLRRDVAELLKHQALGREFLEAPALATVEAGSSEHPGVVIGPYKLIEQIGEGGMGTVWMAQQTEPVKRVVALKVIKAGMDSKQVIARFEAERQALALMDHPHIAKVLDGGTTSAGRPYFVMDLVKGVPITRYCDEHHLTPRQRLELFIPVCQAVQHAHQKGIIHRDLKPSNVLVAHPPDPPLAKGGPGGVPKVIDFGVAKAAGQTLTDKTLVTGFGNIVGTLEYMSPEQAEFNQLDIDTRSDIYSLGVLLYELLTGSPPFSRKKLEKAGMLEMLRVIREEEPTKPSTKLGTAEGLPTLAANRSMEPAKLTKLVRGELDWIVMKALDKDRSRRYETANGFAADVQRYLADEPVQACSPSVAYRLRKFVRRNKVPVMAVAIVFLALLGGIVGTTWGLVRATKAEADAVAESVEKEKALLHKDQALARVQEEQTRTKLALLESRREAVRLAFEQAYGECDRGDSDRGFLAMAYCLSKARQAELPDLEDSIRLHLAGWSRTLRPWRTVFVHEGGSVEPHRKAVTFSPDGRTIVVAGPTSVRSWDVETGELLSHFRRSSLRCTISPNARRVVLVSPLTVAQLYEVATGKPVGLPLKHEAAVTAIAASPDGKTILTASGRSVRLWDAETGTMIGPVFPHGAPVRLVAHATDGKSIWTATDEEARRWDIADGKVIGPVLRHAKGVRCLAVSHDGKMVATAGNSFEVRLWDTATGQNVGPVLPEETPITALALSPDSKSVLACEFKTVRLWDVASGRERSLPLHHQHLVQAVAFSPDGKRALVGTTNAAYLWQLDTQEKGVTSIRPEARVYSAAFSPDGATILAGGTGSASVWKVASGDARGLSLPNSYAVSHLAVSADGKTLLTGCHDEMRLWEAATGKPKGQPGDHKPFIAALAFAPDGKTALTGAVDGTVRRWEVSTGKLQSQFRCDHKTISALTISPDGKMVATAGADRSARLWDAESGYAIARPLLHEDELRSVRFSPNGRFLMSNTLFNTVWLWEAATGAPCGGPIRTDGVYEPSPDARTLVGRHLWETATGKTVGPPFEEGLMFAVMSRDGTTVLTCNSRWLMHLWDIRPVRGEPAQVILWAQVLTGMELDDQGSARVLDFETRRQRRRQLDKLGGPP